MIKNKKGIQLNEAFVSVLTLVLIAVLVIVALYLFGALGNSMQVPNTAGSYVNASMAKPTTAGITLGAASFEDGACGAITKIYNGTNGVEIATNKVIQTGCLVQNATATTGNATTWLVSYPYTYTAESAASNATNDTVDQFTTYPALIGLVGTIIFLGIVIGVLVSSFMPKNSP
jgi:hypothetical protein